MLNLASKPVEGWHKIVCVCALFLSWNTEYFKKKRSRLCFSKVAIKRPNCAYGKQFGVLQVVCWALAPMEFCKVEGVYTPNQSTTLGKLGNRFASTKKWESSKEDPLDSTPSKKLAFYHAPFPLDLATQFGPDNWHEGSTTMVQLVVHQF